MDNEGDSRARVRRRLRACANSITRACVVRRPLARATRTSPTSAQRLFCTFATNQNLSAMTRYYLSNFLIAFIAIWALSACTDTTSSSSGSATATEPVATERSVEEPATPTLAAPDCEIAGEVLEGNRLWLQSSDILAIIKADESTTVEGFGPTHRKLELLDGRSCLVKHSVVLPPNENPDFPYYIADVQYNNVSNVLAVQSTYEVVLCDLENDYNTSNIKPRFFSEREYADAQSGSIQHLELWEDYLIGYCQDAGTFAYDLSDRSAPVAVLPFAEWQNDEDGAYHALFLLENDNGVQAILPELSGGDGAFQLHPLFGQAMNVSTNVARNARNNRFLVLRQTDAEQAPLAIDLKKRTLVDLPADVATQGVQDILAWMRSQQ